MTSQVTFERATGRHRPRVGPAAVIALLLAVGVIIVVNTTGAQRTGVADQSSNPEVAQEDFGGVDEFVAARVESGITTSVLQEDFGGVDEFVAGRVESGITTSVLQEDFTGVE
jgi:hypothetical protein